MPNDAPFELPLKAGPGETSIIDANGDVFAYVTPVGIHAETECRSHFALCVNAHDKLVEACTAFLANPSDTVRITLRCIEAMEVADPAVLNAIIDGVAKDAGLEVDDG